MAKKKDKLQEWTKDEIAKWNKLGGIAHNEIEQAFCDNLERRGLIKHYDSMFGNEYYTITKVGEENLYGLKKRK